jgi:hypothetical protein
MHDYGTGLDMATFEVTANVAIDGVKAGENLARRFQSAGDGIWELRLVHPPASLPSATINVEIRDRQGNVARIERAFSLRTR